MKIPVLTPQQNVRLAGVPTSGRRLYLKVIDGTASPREAIRSMCYECMSYDREEIRNCRSTGCPLHAYRPDSDGQNPVDPAEFRAQDRRSAPDATIRTSSAGKNPKTGRARIPANVKS